MLAVGVSVCLTKRVSVCVFVYLPVYLLVCLSVEDNYLSIQASIRLSFFCTLMALSALLPREDLNIEDHFISHGITSSTLPLTITQSVRHS